MSRRYSKQAPSEEEIKYYISQGYTRTQAKQMIFFWKMEATESAGYLRTYGVTCYDCDESKTFHAACSVLDFIQRHKGHRTWTSTLGKQDALHIERQAGRRKDMR